MKNAETKVNGMDACSWLKGKRETENEYIIRRLDCSDTRVGKRQLWPQILSRVPTKYSYCRRNLQFRIMYCTSHSWYPKKLNIINLPKLYTHVQRIHAHHNTKQHQ